MTTPPPGEPRLFNPDTLKRRRRTRTVALWFGVLIIAILLASVSIWDWCRAT